MASAQPPAGRPQPADLDRTADPGLQPGHPGRPHHCWQPAVAASWANRRRRHI